jgi:hypothetical protein
MTDHVATGVAFLVFGVGLELLAIGALVAYFKRHGSF